MEAQILRLLTQHPTLTTKKLVRTLGLDSVNQLMALKRQLTALQQAGQVRCDDPQFGLTITIHAGPNKNGITVIDSYKINPTVKISRSSPSPHSCPQ